MSIDWPTTFLGKLEKRYEDQNNPCGTAAGIGGSVCVNRLCPVEAGGGGMTKDEALDLALEALEAHADIGIKSDKAITAIKQALAAPVQEPVNGMVLVPYEPSNEMQEQGSTASGYDLSQKRARHVYQSMIDMHILRAGAEPTDQWFLSQAGYTTPPAQPTPAQPAPVPLTDDQISAIGSKIFPSTWNTRHVEFARAIEAAHGIAAATEKGN